MKKHSITSISAPSSFVDKRTKEKFEIIKVKVRTEIVKVSYRKYEHLRMEIITTATELI